MFPFVARVGYKSKGEVWRCLFVLQIDFYNSFPDNAGKITYPCNGVILNQRTVLTTANCANIKFNDYKLWVVVVIFKMKIWTDFSFDLSIGIR